MNQDALLVDRSLDLFIIADGLGGHEEGDVASQIIVDGIRQFILETSLDNDKTWPIELDPHLSYTANRLKAAILVANGRLAGHIAAGAPRGMGATLTAVLFGPDRPVVANVGDCRTYSMDEKGLRQLTRDHSWVAEQVEAGFITAETARAHPWRHMVTRAVQGEPDLLVDTVELDPIQSSGRLLLCSDGLHVPVSDDRIAAILTTPSEGFDNVCEALIQAAIDGGGPDNVSVVLIEYDAATPRDNNAVIAPS